ncbi:MAG: TatD family hydrolase [Gaiellaceae bacterium]
MIDTHAHLDACEPPADDLVARARAVGVDLIVGIGSGIVSCRRELEIAEQHTGVFAGLGVHPHQAADEDAGRLEELNELLADARAVAVGEIGLDYYRDYAPRDAQRGLFRSQLDLAHALGKPVIVHTREADRDTLAVLASFTGTVVLHCFSSPRMLEEALERDYYLSFAGNVTYPRADELRAAVRAVPPERLLLETDSPYLAPQPCRGRPNEPALVVHTLAAVAELRGETVEALGDRIVANAHLAFGLP